MQYSVGRPVPNSRIQAELSRSLTITVKTIATIYFYTETPLSDVSELANDLLNGIGRIISILSVALVATMVLKNHSHLSELDLKDLVLELFN